MQLREVLLGKGEVHIDRVKGLELDDGIAAFQVLPGIDLTDSNKAVERGPDRLPVDRGLRLVNRSTGRFILALALLEGVLRDDLSLPQSGIAFEVVLGEVQFGFRRAKLGLFLTGIELDQQLTVGRMGTRFELDGRHDPGQIGAEHHTLKGSERANCFENRGDRFLFHLQRGDGVGRHLEGFSHRYGLCDLHGLPPCDADYEKDHSQNCQKNDKLRPLWWSRLLMYGKGAGHDCWDWQIGVLRERGRIVAHGIKRRGSREINT